MSCDIPEEGSSVSSSPGGHLEGRWALVTGGKGAIGAAILKSLAAYGANLLVQDRSIGDAEAEIRNSLVALGAGKVEFQSFDLANRSACIDGFERIRDLVEVDIVVNSAGIQHVSPMDSLAQETWDSVLAINLSAAFDAMRIFLPGMGDRGYGRVVNIASVHALVGSIDKAPYVAAKHGLLGLTKVAALEYAGYGDARSGGVTVNAICPGWVETPLIAPQISRLIERDKLNHSEAARKLLSAKQPSQRFTQPADVAAMVCFLTMPVCHNITGTALPIDGGWTAQ